MYRQIEAELPNVHMHEGLPNRSLINELVANCNHLAVCLDDMQSISGDSKLIERLFLIDSHHIGFSVFLVTQNLFCAGKCMRNISLNSSYILLFKSLRARNQVQVLNNQIFPLNNTRI
jgi:hypothetical protein